MKYSNLLRIGGFLLNVRQNHHNFPRHSNLLRCTCICLHRSKPCLGTAPVWFVISHLLVWLFDERGMDTEVAINAKTMDDSYSVAQNRRRHDDGTL